MGEHKVMPLKAQVSTRLYHESYTGIDRDVVNNLCQYFDCKIEDLFEFIPDESTAINNANTPE